MDEDAIDLTNVGWRRAYKAAVKGEIDTLKELYQRNPASQIHISGNTVLHVLTLHRRTDVIRKLLHLPLHTHGLMVQNHERNTALHEAVRLGYKEIAELMVNKEQNLVSTRNQLGETPIYWAAAYGQKEMFSFLIYRSHGEDELKRDDGNTILHAAVMGEYYDLALMIMNKYPHLALEDNKMGKTVLHILAQSPSSFKSGTLYSNANIGCTPFLPLQMLAMIIYCCIPSDYDYGDRSEDLENKSHVESQLSQCSQDNYYRSGWTKKMIILITKLPFLRNIYYAKQKHKNAVELVKQLTTKVSDSPKGSYYVANKRNVMLVEKRIEDYNTDCQLPGEKRIIEVHAFLSQAKKLGIVKCVVEFLEAIKEKLKKSTVEDPLFLATKFGIVEIVSIVLDEFPEAIESLDENGKNILHLAAEYRQESVFEFLLSRKEDFLLDKMVAGVDNEGNTPLHLAAKYDEVHQPKYAFNISLQLRREVFWFKRLKSVAKSQRQLFYLENAEGKKAEELFNETHTEMLDVAEKWNKNTTNILMIISTLICTIIAAAALAVPGEFDEKGIVKLIHETGFSLFLMYLGASAIFTIGTMGIAYYSHSSRFQIEDHYIFIPLKYLMVANFFYLSIIYTTATMTQGIILVTKGEYTILSWLPLCTGFSMIIYIDQMFPAMHYLLNVIIHIVKTAH